MKALGGNDNEPDEHPINEDAFEDLTLLREFLVESEAFKNLRAQVHIFVISKPPKLTDMESIGEIEQYGDEQTDTHILAKSEASFEAILTWQIWLEDVKQNMDKLFHETSIFSIVISALFLILDAFFLATDGLLITMRQLEPALKQNMVRLQWRCVCIPLFLLLFASYVRQGNSDVAMW